MSLKDKDNLDNQGGPKYKDKVQNEKDFIYPRYPEFTQLKLSFLKLPLP